MSHHISWELHAKTVTTTIRDITPEGVKMEVNYQAKAGGKVAGMVTGTVTIHSKPDGSSTWEDKLMAMTDKGEMFVGWGKGTGKMSSPGMSAYEGEVQTMSQSPGLTWMNDHKFKVKGTADMAKGDSHAEFEDSK